MLLLLQLKIYQIQDIYCYRYFYRLTLKVRGNSNSKIEKKNHILSKGNKKSSPKLHLQLKSIMLDPSMKFHYCKPSTFKFFHALDILLNVLLLLISYL